MIPIYRTDGEWVAVYEKGHIFDIDGEWIGKVVGREVYGPTGHYLGFLSDDKRLLRRRTRVRKPQIKVPDRPKRPRIPVSMPLAPLMRELPHHLIDLFEEYGKRLPFVTDLLPDME